MKTKLIIGLGNPGEQYTNNRHNAGFFVLDELAKQKDLTWKKKGLSLVSGFTDVKTKFILVKPQTFMNNSGEAVQVLKRFYKLENAEITVIHDELDLLFGTVRTKTDGGSAGHKGVQSIIDHIGPDFNRLRLGIHTDLATLTEADVFVLGDFSQVEQEKLDEIIKNILENLLNETVRKG